MSLDGSAAGAMGIALGTRVVRVDAERREVEIEFMPGSQFLQGAGVVQGGAVAAMLDVAMVCAALAVIPDGKSVVTSTLNVSYLRAARHGRFRAIGTVERSGRTLVFARARLEDAHGEPVASGSSSLPVVERKGGG
jgi:uncharacterized protein (TIGR00369 family)